MGKGKERRGDRICHLLCANQCAQDRDAPALGSVLPIRGYMVMKKMDNA